MIFLQWIPWILRMSRPGEKITRKSILMQKKIKELDKTEVRRLLFSWKLKNKSTFRFRPSPSLLTFLILTTTSVGAPLLRAALRDSMLTTIIVVVWLVTAVFIQGTIRFNKYQSGLAVQLSLCQIN